MKNGNQIDHLAILILAAGSSSRLGQPKQLLQFKGKPLLQNMIDIAKNVCSEVIVVLGSNHKLIKSKVNLAQIKADIFEKWENGMGASIAFGTDQILTSYPKTEQIMILLCDQIHISTNLIEKLTVMHNQSKRLITACRYGDSFGVPAIFDRTIFQDLLALNGEKGAKKIIRQHYDQSQFIDFPDGLLDIDTPDDLNMLR